MRKISLDLDNVDYSLVEKAGEVIRNGGIVALPTETVYGLAVRADNKEAVNKLYEIKRRPKDKPFSYAVADPSLAIDHYFATLPPFGYRLMEKLWPGPLTIVYYSLQNKKIGVRVPLHPLARQLIKRANCPIYLPSANISGEKETNSAANVEEIFDGKIDLIIDAGSSPASAPSTVVDLTLRPFQILRKGVASERAIINVFVKKRILFVCTGNTCRSPIAYFLLKKYLGEIKPYLNDRYEVISRGVSFFDSSPPAPNVVKILENKEGLSTEDFLSKRLQRNIILSSDFIFTMEDRHRDYLLRLEPTAEGRVIPLKKFLPQGEEEDIPDPIGKGYDVYERVYKLIKKAILELVEWL